LLGSTSAQSKSNDHEQAKKGIQLFSVHSYLLLQYEIGFWDGENLRKVIRQRTPPC
jgi:hypothetical protein